MDDSTRTTEPREPRYCQRKVNIDAEVAAIPKLEETLAAIKRLPRKRRYAAVARAEAWVYHLWRKDTVDDIGLRDTYHAYNTALTVVLYLV